MIIMLLCYTVIARSIYVGKAKKTKYGKVCAVNLSPLSAGVLQPGDISLLLDLQRGGGGEKGPKTHLRKR